MSLGHVDLDGCSISDQDVPKLFLKLHSGCCRVANTLCAGAYVWDEGSKGKLQRKRDKVCVASSRVANSDNGQSCRYLCYCGLPRVYFRCLAVLEHMNERLALLKDLITRFLPPWPIQTAFFGSLIPTLLSSMPTNAGRIA